MKGPKDEAPGPPHTVRGVTAPDALAQGQRSQGPASTKHDAAAVSQRAPMSSRKLAPPPVRRPSTSLQVPGSIQTTMLDTAPVDPRGFHEEPTLATGRRPATVPNLPEFAAPDSRATPRSSAVVPPALAHATTESARNSAPPEIRDSRQPARNSESPHTRGSRRRLGEVLVAAGVATEEDIQRALAVQKMGGGRLGGILVKLKLVTDSQIRTALQEQLGVEVVDLGDVKLDETVIKLLPQELIKKYEAIPVRSQGTTLYVAMKDPYNFTAVDDIRFFTGMSKVVVLACTEAAYAKFVEDHLQTQSLVQEILDGGDFYAKAVSSIETERVDGPAGDDDSSEIVHDLRLAGEHPPIITLCNFLLVESIQRRASDIHIEPYETYFRVRVRVDGRLQTLITPPQRLHGPMITRMKIMADMDISKRRVPQDGHIAIVFRGETCHYRVSTLPTVYGEKCVIRLLKKDERLAGIDTLGFDADVLAKLKKVLKAPQGILLVTGPTGSGKTTTLHAGLDYINDPETNIVTLEDPVELSISGINHVQIHEKAGVTFASGLRSILRQDPDVVFVGEMRDPEVSQIAVKAALTGHLVLSTLHTNSAAESLMRLEDMGVASYLLANALLMIIAQRLVRRVCRLCGEPYVPTPEEIDEFELSPEVLSTSHVVKGKGCDACYQTGYHGRQAVYEVLQITNPLRTKIRAHAPVEEIIECAEQSGMKVLFDAGVEQVLRGETTFEEIRRCLTDAR